MLPSLSCNEGTYSAMGYSGNGVAMAPYLGHKAALKILNPEQKEQLFLKKYSITESSLLFWSDHGFCQ